MKNTRTTAARNLVGPRIRLARLKANPQITQEDLAGRLAARGVFLDRSAVSRVESQDRYLMDFEVAAVAASLKVSVAWLYGQAEKPAPDTPP
jgi:transcriptional regulator with XRE-family HTH domain